MNDSSEFVTIRLLENEPPAFTGDVVGMTQPDALKRIVLGQAEAAGTWKPSSEQLAAAARAAFAEIEEERERAGATPEAWLRVAAYARVYRRIATALAV